MIHKKTKKNEKPSLKSAAICKKEKKRKLKEASVRNILLHILYNPPAYAFFTCSFQNQLTNL